MKPIGVGVLGATGLVGQRYVELLASHPWFSIKFLAASQKSSGDSYAQATKGRYSGKIFANQQVHSLEEIELAGSLCQLVFSALPSSVAAEYEPRYAKAGLTVLSSASYHRMHSDIPVIIPEINSDHLHILSAQRQKRKWRGAIVTKPNCSLQSYLLPLWPLHQAFEVTDLIVTTLQAVSGAGYRGVSAYEIGDNVIPYIEEEERKSELEPCKIFGRVERGEITPYPLKISAHCNRVAVLDGHLACVSVQFKRKACREEILEAWRDFHPLLSHALPSAPLTPIIYREEPNRPQPRLDRMAGEGMAVTVGRLRSCPVLDYRFVGLSHNCIRGAAGGGILTAELIVKETIW